MDQWTEKELDEIRRGKGSLGYNDITHPERPNMSEVASMLLIVLEALDRARDYDFDNARYISDQAHELIERLK